MKTSDFSFELPQELIAQVPSGERGHSRLMVLDRTGTNRQSTRFDEIGNFLPPGSIIVLNNSRVRNARLYGIAELTGTETEFLLVRRESTRRWLAIGSHSRRMRAGRRYHFPDETTGVITAVNGPYREIEFDREIDNSWLDLFGHVPLPPYISRDDSPEDAERYQTVYANVVGSVAAPTAGLHFTPELLQRLQAQGVAIEYVTLHVGIGTFLPVRTEKVEEHQMHQEEFYISPRTAGVISRGVKEGRTIIAVGTTAVRTLESAWDESTGQLRSGHRNTDLFIYPGFRFNVVRQLITNFHTPESSLLMLVSAFAGRDFILESYREAVSQGFRFFSYGDAMLIR